MKKIFTILLAITFATLASAQTNVMLHFNHNVDGTTLQNSVAYSSADNYNYKVTRLAYYISEISIKHDGGQVLPITDMHLLVDAFTDNEISLGTLAVTNIEGITFHLGVDEAFNHLNPASYSADNPLAPQNPSMHWGWAAGYRFLAYEGDADNGTGTFANVFQIHTLGDVNYSKVELDVTGVQEGLESHIYLDANYNKLLENMNVSTGVISHSETDEAAKAISNLKTKVFAASTSATQELDVAGAWSISPNPASKSIRISLDLVNTNNVLVVYNMQGTEVLRQQLDNQTIINTNLAQGMYVATLLQDSKIIGRKMLSIVD